MAKYTIELEGDPTPTPPSITPKDFKALSAAERAFYLVANPSVGEKIPGKNFDDLRVDLTRAVVQEAFLVDDPLRPINRGSPLGGNATPKQSEELFAKFGIKTTYKASEPKLTETKPYTLKETIPAMPSALEIKPDTLKEVIPVETSGLKKLWDVMQNLFKTPVMGF